VNRAPSNLGDEGLELGFGLDVPLRIGSRSQAPPELETFEVHVRLGVLGHSGQPPIMARGAWTCPLLKRVGMLVRHRSH